MTGDERQEFRLDETNDRLNRLYEVVVRREEHEGLSQLERLGLLP